MGSKLIWSRAGTFRVSDDLINDENTEMLRKEIFSKCIIIESRHDPFVGEIVYKALSPYFDSLPYGEKMPEYRAIIHKSAEGEYAVKWEHVPIIPSDIDEIISILDDAEKTAEQKVSAIEIRLHLTRQIRKALEAAKKSPRANPVAAQDAGSENDPGYAGPGNVSLPVVDGQDGVSPTKTEGS